MWYSILFPWKYYYKQRLQGLQLLLFKIIFSMLSCLCNVFARMHITTIFLSDNQPWYQLGSIILTLNFLRILWSALRYPQLLLSSFLPSFLPFPPLKWLPAYYEYLFCSRISKGLAQISDLLLQHSNINLLINII
jgi:hypothetical protein